MPEWLTWKMVVGGLGALAGIFEAIDGLASGFSRTKALGRWVRRLARVLISPWATAGRMEALERRLTTLEAALSTALKPTEHFRGARWAHVRREARNVAFCDVCYQNSSGQKMHRLNEGIVENECQLLFCAGDDRHRLRMPVKDYEFGTRMQIGGQC